MSLAITITLVRPSKDVLFFGDALDADPKNPTAAVANKLKAARAAVSCVHASQLSDDKLVQTITQTFPDKATYDKYQASNKEDIAAMDTARDAYNTEKNVLRSVVLPKE